MRRSCAPSMKRPQPAACVAKPPLVSSSVATAGNSKQPATSSSSSKENVCALPKDTVTVFKVVWGKISTRKHKTWEGDGTLEVSGRSAVLRDETGKVIATASGLKLEEVTEGIQMIVGSKEVEVLERITESIEPVSNRSENVPPKSKLPRISKPPSTSFKPPEQKKAEPDPPEPISSPDESLTAKDSFTKVEVQKPSVTVGSVNRQFKPIAMPNTGPDEEGSTDEQAAVVVEPLFMRKPSFEHRFHHNPNNELTVADVQVPACLAKHLRPHQREGVAFLYECVTGMRMMEPPPDGGGYYGAILADEMGLGKTLQCIALMYTLLKTGPYGKPLARRILIVTPSSLVENWDREITKWLRNERLFTFIVGPHNKLRLYAQSLHIPVLIISYEMLAKQIAELETVKFDLIFCDEGHRLKNSNVKAFGVLSKLECRRRVLITGTPIQNDLAEFYSLINFVNPGVLGAYPDFKARYETPIIISQRPGVLPQSIELGIERLNELNIITGRFVLRRTQEVINRYLPEKHELVVFCHPSELQTKLLRTALAFYEEERNGSSAITPLQLITILKKICNHPSLVKVTGRGDPESLLHRLADQLPDWQSMGPSDSAKLAVVDTLLEELIVKQEKVVIVSYYNKTLDMIAGLCAHYNYKHTRLDGSTAASDRSKIVATFNSAGSDIFILLLSAKAGGAGLNLIGASRLVLYDNDWNPANDLQAMSRVWRDGQARTVFIYRLLTAFSIEERIFQRQISKTSLSGTVVDRKRNMNNLQFSDEELKDLFTFVDPQQADDDCLTHSLLECPCAGIGTVPEPEGAEAESSDELDRLLREPPILPESRYRVRRHGAPGGGGGGRKKTKYALKMQELMRWEHHRSPVSESVMEQLGLSRCSDDEVVFLFRNIVSDGQ